LANFSGTLIIEPTDFAVCPEGKVIFDKLTFIRAISLMFSTYSVLNMGYPTMAAATIEFIQQY
jgi:hypothetical protein